MGKQTKKEELIDLLKHQVDALAWVVGMMQDQVDDNDI